MPRQFRALGSFTTVELRLWYLSRSWNNRSINLYFEEREKKNLPKDLIQFTSVIVSFIHSETIFFSDDSIHFHTLWSIQKPTYVGIFCTYVIFWYCGWANIRNDWNVEPFFWCLSCGRQHISYQYNQFNFEGSVLLLPTAAISIILCD